MISYHLPAVIITCFFCAYLKANIIDITRSLQQRGSTCLHAFHGKGILETEPMMEEMTPWLLTESHVIPEAIKNIMGTHSFCLALIVAGTDRKALAESHAILKHFPLSILVIIADDINNISNFDNKDDTIILQRENKRRISSVLEKLQNYQL